MTYTSVCSDIVIVAASQYCDVLFSVLMCHTAKPKPKLVCFSDVSQAKVRSRRSTEANVIEILTQTWKSPKIYDIGFSQYVTLKDWDNKY